MFSPSPTLTLSRPTSLLLPPTSSPSSSSLSPSSPLLLRPSSPPPSSIETPPSLDLSLLPPSSSFYFFVEYSMIYSNVFLKIFLGLVKLSRIAFPGIFVTVCFLIILLLPKQTIPTKKKSTTQRKYKNGPKANLTFYNLCHSLLIIFLVLLSNKTKRPRDTSMRYNNIKCSNFFSINFLDMLYRYQFSYFTLANIRLNK